MSFFRGCLLAVAISSCGSAFALPQPTIELGFSSGRVSISAVDAPVADVLRAWANVGHSQVTGTENLGARRITLRVSNAPEEAVLAAVVGDRSWFKATTREFSGVSESTLGHIDILAAALSANVKTATPEQRYDYPETAMAPEVAGWAAGASTSAGSTRSQAYPETIYEYPNPGGFGDPLGIVASANASNQQPIIQPGTEAPVPERIYEYPAVPKIPEWMLRPMPIPNLPIVDGFGEGTLPGETVDPSALDAPGGFTKIVVVSA